jgi:hypothetical protein
MRLILTNPVPTTPKKFDGRARQPDNFALLRMGKTRVRGEMRNLLIAQTAQKRTAP